MSILGSHIQANLTRPIFTGSGGFIPADLTGYQFEPCSTQWSFKPGDEIDFSLNEAWAYKPSDAVNFNFTCVVECTNLWNDYPGYRVPLAFNKPWVDHPGNQVPLTFECEGGAEPGPTYTYFSGYIDWPTGENLGFNFAPSFIFNFGEGAYTYVDLYTPDTAFPLNPFQTGESFEFLDIETQIRFAPNAWTGENVNSDFITFFPAQNLDPIFYDGSSVQADIATDTTLPANAYSGEYVFTALDTVSAITLNPIFYTGESVSALLQANESLDNINGYSGEYTNVTLTDNPLWEPSFNFYEGSNVTVSITTTDSLQPRAYDGSELTFVLTDNPAPEMLLTAYAGEYAQVGTIATSLSLGVVSALDGSFATIVAMDNEQFWNITTGESLETELSTETTLPLVGYASEVSEVDIEVRGSEGIGSLEMYEGTIAHIGDGSSGGGITVPKTVFLYPNTISDRQYFYCEFDVNTSFDLLNTSCCPDLETHERIELTAGPKVDEHYHGDKTIVQMELSTLPRFQMDFKTGETFVAVDPNYFPPFDFYDGHQVPVYIEFNRSDTIVDFKLCYGNFIPDGDLVFIELVSTYDDGCEAHYAYTGEACEIELENNVQDQVNNYVGEYMSFDLVIEPIMLFVAYEGQYARISNPEFTFLASDGARGTFDFYEPPWFAAEGQHMAPINLVTDYDVEFLEQGCLDNEYVPTNENGDPDWEKFNRVPVELEPYRHSIKARCF